MKKFGKYFTIIMALMLSLSLQVFAQGSAALIEVHDNEGAPELFVKGVAGVDSATAIVGNSECEVEVSGISESGVYIDTLILIDNSMSVPQESLDQIKNIIIQLVGARKDGQERFSVTTYSESVGEIPDFSFDYQSIQASINSIERKNQDTRLTDAIANVFKSGLFDDAEECAYRRLIVCSDGVDDQGGYSTAERDEIIKNSNVPIYTIGVYDNKGTNDAALADFFSLSRETGADYFLLSNRPAEKVTVLVDGDSCYQVKDSSEWNIVSEALSLDRDIVKFNVLLTDDVKDGSSKTITVKFDSSEGEQSVTADNIRMPHVVIEKEEPKPEPEPEPEAEPEPEPEEVVEEPEPEQTFLQAHGLLILIAALVLAAVVLVVVLILVLKRAGAKKKERNGITEVDPGILGDPFAYTERREFEHTEMLGVNPPPGDGNTVMIFNHGRSYTITLTDVSSPARFFSKPIDEVVVIGTAGVDIVIDYDKAISHRHCQIKRMGDKFYIEDLHSTNGTYVNDSRVLSEVELFSGNVLTLGTHKFRVEMS